MKERTLKRALFISILVLSIFGAATFLPWAWAAISNISGIAVQGSSIQWNNVKDAYQGDALTSGLPATGLYGYNGATWDRLRGDTTNGLDVDVTRISGTVTITSATDNVTPSDAYVNPTTASQNWSLLGGWNGTTWDRLKAIGGNLQVQTTTSSSFTTGQVAIDNTAPLVIAANAARKSLMIRNLSSQTDAYIGSDNTVLSTTGFMIRANESVTLDRTTAAVYGVTAGAGTTTFAYLEE